MTTRKKKAPAKVPATRAELEARLEADAEAVVKTLPPAGDGSLSPKDPTIEAVRNLQATVKELVGPRTRPTIEELREDARDRLKETDAPELPSYEIDDQDEAEKALEAELAETRGVIETLAEEIEASLAQPKEGEEPAPPVKREDCVKRLRALLDDEYGALEKRAEKLREDFVAARAYGDELETWATSTINESEGYSTDIRRLVAIAYEHGAAFDELFTRLEHASVLELVQEIALASGGTHAHRTVDVPLAGRDSKPANILPFPAAMAPSAEALPDAWKARLFELAREGGRAPRLEVADRLLALAKEIGWTPTPGTDERGPLGFAPSSGPGSSSATPTMSAPGSSPQGDAAALPGKDLAPPGAAQASSGSSAQAAAADRFCAACWVPISAEQDDDLCSGCARNREAAEAKRGRGRKKAQAAAPPSAAVQAPSAAPAQPPAPGAPTACWCNKPAARVLGTKGYCAEHLPLCQAGGPACGELATAVAAHGLLACPAHAPGGVVLAAVPAAQNAAPGATAVQMSVVKPDVMPLPDVIARVQGKPFRCECGCNVFRHPEGEPDVFVCNACHARFVGERAEPAPAPKADGRAAAMADF